MKILFEPFRKILNLLGVQIISLNTYNQFIERIKDTHALRQRIKNLTPRLAAPLIVQQTELAEFCLENLQPTSKSIMLARGIEALPSVIAMGQEHDIPTVCDVIEVLEYEQRVAHRNAAPGVRLITENAQRSMLPQCDHVITVSKSIAKHLAEIKVKAQVMDQWHISNAYEINLDITETLAAKKYVIVINCLQNEVGSLEAALEGFAAANLEDSICLVAGRINPPHFEKHIRELISESRFNGKVQILGLMDSNTYGTILAHANVGLVTLDPEIGNHKASFPNRVVDFAAFGVPMCTPALPDIINEPKLNSYLHLVNDVSNSNDWCKAILEITNQQNNQLKPVLAGKNWSKAFIKNLSDSEEVFLIDNSWGWHGNRVKRQIMAILESGRKVTYVYRQYIKDENGRRKRHPDGPFAVEHFSSLDQMPQKPAWTE